MFDSIKLVLVVCLIGDESPVIFGVFELIQDNLFLKKRILGTGEIFGVGGVWVRFKLLESFHQ